MHIRDKTIYIHTKTSYNKNRKYNYTKGTHTMAILTDGRILSYEYTGQPDLLPHVEQTLDEIKALQCELERRGDYVDEETHPTNVCVFGLYYTPGDFFIGVSADHESSSGVATMQCILIPSADMYEFEVSVAFLDEYVGILRTRLTMFEPIDHEIDHS